jgi:hypothetical protein
MGNGNGDKKKSTTTTTTPPRSMMEKFAGLFMPKSFQDRIDKNKEAETGVGGGGNPGHYQTHVGDRQGKNRQPRKGGRTCHHGKS